MTDLTPPPELVQQWFQEWNCDSIEEVDSDIYVATRAAQWGADQELGACCEWVQTILELPGCANQLRTARRPKPLSLKEQALEELDGIAAVFRVSHGGNLVCDTIRRALEALPND